MLNKRCILFLLLAFCLSFSPTSFSRQVGSSHPNIVVIFIDDMGWGDVSFNNPSVNYTPNFAWLAQHGLQLSNFYVSQAVCTASRASLLTGCYTNRLGLSGAIDHSSKIGLNPDETTIADMLNAINLPRDRYHAHFNLHRYLVADLCWPVRQPGQHRSGAFRLHAVDSCAD